MKVSFAYIPTRCCIDGYLESNNLKYSIIQGKKEAYFSIFLFFFIFTVKWKDNYTNVILKLSWSTTSRKSKIDL